MRLTVFFIILSFTSSTAVPDTINVPTDYASIQDAIDASKNGDTILVDTGTYVENIDFKGKAVTVKSSGGADATIIDGNQSERVVSFMSGEGPDSVIDGFTLCNGYASCGAGICCASASPTIVNNVIKKNIPNTSAFIRGIGIYCENASPIISNNSIINNRFWYADGGGLLFRYCQGPIITSNLISNNEAMGGGGISSYKSTLHISENTISDNRAELYGAGICLWNADALIENNIIKENEAGDDGGGGIYCYESTSEIINNVIMNNIVEYNGGGICCKKCSDIKVIDNIVKDNKFGGIVCYENSSSLILNTIFEGNDSDSGGGICQSQSKTKIINCTIFNNLSFHGGGIYCGTLTEIEIYNTILWNNRAIDYGSEIYISYYKNPSIVTIDNSDVHGGQSLIYMINGSILNWGQDMIDADPLFVDPGIGDLHLRYTSPCRNAGDNGAFNLPDKDFEGDPRVADGIVDIGADEFYTHLYYKGDPIPGKQVDLRFIGKPQNNVMLFVGMDIFEPPITTKYGDWYLQNPVIPIAAGKTTWAGVLLMTERIPLNQPVPSTVPLQAIVRDQLTNLCNLHID